MKTKLVITKFEPDEDEFIVFNFSQYRNKDRFWVFQIIFFNFGFYITPLFLYKT